MTLAQVRLEAKFGKQFQFKSKDEVRLRRRLCKDIEKAPHEFEDFEQRCFRLGYLFNERGGIGCLLDAAQFTTNRRKGFADADFAQGMKFRTTAPDEAEVGEIK